MVGEHVVDTTGVLVGSGFTGRCCAPPCPIQQAVDWRDFDSEILMLSCVAWSGALTCSSASEANRLSPWVPYGGWHNSVGTVPTDGAEGGARPHDR